MTTVSPYQLSLTIIRGENLPVGDITTSDPYVKVFIDNKEIGSTKVVKRNLNPIWNYSLNENLQSINDSVLLLHVMDEDQHSEDDVLGVITINLTNVECNQIIDHKYPLEQFGNQVKARGFIYIQIKLTRNDNEIKITENNNDTVGLLPWKYDNTITMNLIKSKMLSYDSPTVNVIDAYSYVLKDLPNYSQTIADFLFDIKQLNNKNIDITEDILNKSIIRRSRQTSKTSILPIHSNYSPNDLPILNHGVKLNFIDKTMLIELNSKYSTWNFIRWINISLKYWRKEISLKELPEWMISDYQSNVNVTVKSSDEAASNNWQGLAVIKLSQPYSISLLDNLNKTLYDSIDVAHLLSITISNDSSIPSQISILLQIDLLKSVSKSITSSMDPDEKFGPKGHIGFRRFLRKSTHHLLSTVTSTAKIITSGEAVQKIVSAPTEVIKVGTEVIKVGKELVTLVSTTTGGIIFHGITNQEITYVILKYNNSNFISILSNHSDNSIDNQIILDIESSDFIMSLDLLNNSNKLVYEKTIDIYLYKGLIGHEKLIGQSYIHLTDLLMNKFEKFSYDDLDNYLTTDNELVFDKEIGFSITLLSGKGVRTPSVSLPGRGMYISCRLVDSKGKSINSESQMSSRVVPTHNPDWKSETLFIVSDNDIDKSSFVRLKIHGGLTTYPEVLGYVLIPITDFYEREIEKELQITSFKPLHGNPGYGGLYGNGTLNVRIQKIYEKKSNLNDNIESINIQSKLINHSVFNSFYPCDILLSNNYIDSFVEYYYLSICSSDYLLLIESNNVTNINDSNDNISNIMKSSQYDLDSALESSVDSQIESLGSKGNSSDCSTEHHTVKHIDISIYENQRRNIFPPYDWGDNNLFKFERSQYSNETGSQSYKSLTLINPPLGYEWIDKGWELDKTYIPTDHDGWTYGFHFNDIVKNYKHKLSSTSPALMSVRTRKWIRKAKSNGYKLDSKELNRIDSSLDVKADVTANQKLTSTESIQSIGQLENSPRNLLQSRSDSANDTTNSSRHHSISSTRRNTGITITTLDWRLQDFNLNNNKSIMKYCKENNYPSIYLTITWDNVFNPVIVSDSILSLNVRVNRYFGINRSNEPIFRQVIMDIYITNCPANHLYNIISERILFYVYRVNIRNLLDNKSIDKDYIEELDNQVERDDIEETGTPVTVELSFGSTIVSGIEFDVINIDKNINQLYHAIYDNETNTEVVKKLERKKNGDSQIDRHVDRANHVRLDSYLHELSDLHLLAIRSCRLRLYISVILSNNLLSHQSFDVADVQNYIKNDVKTMLSINLSDEVSTNSNRIQYLLDIAEKRIRDLCICGWSKRSHGFEICLTTYINKYLFVIIEYLSIYFKQMNNMKLLKGLSSKLTLISTITRYNDTLANLTDQCLFYYKLIPNIKPYLTVYLNFNLLLSWYTVIISQDMIEIVNNAVKVQKSKPSSSTNTYTTNLPWYPIREGLNNNGIFMTNLPEDIIQYLNTYIEYAKLTSADVSHSLISLIKKVDIRISLSYTLAYQKLIQEYYFTTISTNWINSIKNKLINFNVFSDNDDMNMFQLLEKEQAEIDERMEFLSSIVNDIIRILNNNSLLLPNSNQSKGNHSPNKNSEIEQQLQLNIQLNNKMLIKTQSICIEYLSIMILYDIFTMNSFLLTNFIIIYIDERINNIQFYDTSIFLIYKNFEKRFYGILNYLDDYGLYLLLSQCIEKFMIRYYYIIYDIDRNFYNLKLNYNLIIKQLLYDCEYLFKMINNINIKFNNIFDKYLSKINNINENIELLINIIKLLTLELTMENVNTIFVLIKNHVIKQSNKETIGYLNLLQLIVSIRNKLNIDNDCDIDNEIDITNSISIHIANNLIPPTDIPNYTSDELTEKLLELPCNVSIIYKIFYLSSIIDIKDKNNIFTLYKLIFDGIIHDNELDDFIHIYDHIVNKKDKNSDKLDNSNSKQKRSSIFDIMTTSNRKSLDSSIQPIKIPSNIQYIIIISQIKVNNLFIIDSFRLPTTYLIISITSVPLITQTYQTNVIHNNFNPQWNDEGPFSFSLTKEQSNLSNREIQIDVMYKNRLIGEELIGTCKYSLLNVDTNSNHEVESEINIQNSSKRIIEHYNKAFSVNPVKPIIKFSITIQSVSESL